MRGYEEISRRKGADTVANKGIKGITIEIGGDTTFNINKYKTLEKALSGVNGKVRNTQAELREVNKLLKMDPGNTEALAQKQTILSEAIAETKEKLDILKTAERQVQEQFQRGEVSGEQYRALKREIERTSLELEDLEEGKERGKLCNYILITKKVTRTSGSTSGQGRGRFGGSGRPGG